MKKFNEELNKADFDSFDFSELYNECVKCVGEGHSFWDNGKDFKAGREWAEDVEISFWTEDGDERSIRFILYCSDVNGLESFEPYTEEKVNLFKN